MMDPTKEQLVCIKFCANLGRSAMQTLAIIRQAFGEENMSCKWVFEWHARFRAGRTSIENDQHTGPSAVQHSTLLPHFSSSFVRVDVKPFKTLLVRSELVMMGHAIRF
jgi:hypothetical protein